MQGFNRYYPPDYDPAKHATLNAVHGKHALGVRAHKIDQGILVVRFEAPFDIVCGKCQTYIGAGTRWNAEKKKVGNYYSTPIYEFTCKCAKCQNSFKIQTDPKNARYIVTEGAREKISTWENPEEDGGFAAHDTDAPSAADGPPADAFLALEKSISQADLARSKAQRQTQLEDLSHRLHDDPYTWSQTLRKKFREQKKVDLGVWERDEALKERLGLGVRLLGEVEGEGKEEWSRAVQRRGGGSGSGSGGVTSTPKGKQKASSSSTSTPNALSNTEELAETIRKNTIKRIDPFGQVDKKVAAGVFGIGKDGFGQVKLKGKGKGKLVMNDVDPVVVKPGLVDYCSDSD